MKPGPAFVDTSVLVAALLKRDTNHVHALPILRAADSGAIAPLVLTDFILVETLNFLGRKGNAEIARDALRRIEESQGLRVERVPDEIYVAAKDGVFHEHAELSFVDAVTVAFMRRRRLRWIYSFDAGFDRVKGIDRAAATLA